MAITDKEKGVWGLDQVYNKINQGSIWEYTTSGDNFKLFSWGVNDGGFGINGQLGHNNQTNYSSPTQIPGTTWSIIGSSTYFSISTGAIKSDGTLWMWGQNANGGLGQNNTTGYSSPKQVPGTTWANVVTSASNPAIPAKPSTMAVKTDGTLWSWGSNEQGRLGHNQNDTTYSSPKQVGSDTTWATGVHKMSVGQTGAAGGIKTDGTLWTWGCNQEGELGHSNTTSYSSPVQIPGTTWRSVIAHGSNISATKTDGTMWVWGNNSSGQLGLNSTTNYSSPKQIPGNWKIGSGLTGFRDGCGIKTDGTAWAWGHNSYGNNGTNLPGAVKYSSPVQIGSDTTWNAVSVNSYYALGLKTDNTLWSWGYSQKGSLGLNQTGPMAISSPVQIPGTTWSSLPIVVGPYKSLALKQ